MKKYIVLSIVLLCFLAIANQFTFSFENDILGQFGDDDYSHGTQIEYVDDSLWHYKWGLNMYTPEDIRIEEHVVGDRPYCGYMYLGFGKELFADEASPWTHYAEVDVGVIGPAALCKETLTLIHRWCHCRKPMGWDNQLHNEPTLNGQWWTKYNWWLNDYMMIVPRGGTFLGTVQDGLELGADLKIGWNMKKDVGNGIFFSAPAKPVAHSFLDDVSAYVFIGADERYYLYNHILEGSLFNSADDDLGVEIYHFVPEWRTGISVQYMNYFVRYYIVFRNHEFKNLPNRADYGGLVFGVEF